MTSPRRPKTNVLHQSTLTLGEAVQPVGTSLNSLCQFGTGSDQLSPVSFDFTGSTPVLSLGFTGSPFQRDVC